MANLDQKTLLTEELINNIKELCIKYQNDSGSLNSEVESLLIEIAHKWDSETNNFGFRK